MGGQGSREQTQSIDLVSINFFMDFFFCGHKTRMNNNNCVAEKDIISAALRIACGCASKFSILECGFTGDDEKSTGEAISTLMCCGLDGCWYAKRVEECNKKKLKL